VLCPAGSHPARATCHTLRPAKLSHLEKWGGLRDWLRPSASGAAALVAARRPFRFAPQTRFAGSHPARATCHTLRPAKLSHLEKWGGRRSSLRPSAPGAAALVAARRPFRFAPQTPLAC